jgi:UTP--glucose-1-phosphate uridylyltransferase
MKVRKAVIPAAGLGTRFLPVTKAQPKEMLPVVDKPAIQYVVEEAVRAGIDDILIISGRGKRSIEDHFDRNIELELELEERGKTDALKEIKALSDLAAIHFIRQGEALGLGHAVSMARKHVGDEPFVVMLGDDLIDERVLLLEAMIAEAERIGRSVIALMEVDDPSLYGCARIGAEDGDVVRIHELVEKPSRDLAPSNLAIMGRYVFTSDIFGALERVQPGVGGEIQLTDAMVMLLDGVGVYGYPFSEGRFDTGNKLDYLRANIELAARRDDLGPGLRAYIAEFAKREGLLDS